MSVETRALCNTVYKKKLPQFIVGDTFGSFQK